MAGGTLVASRAASGDGPTRFCFLSFSKSEEKRKKRFVFLLRGTVPGGGDLAALRAFLLRNVRSRHACRARHAKPSVAARPAGQPSRHAAAAAFSRRAALAGLVLSPAAAASAAGEINSPTVSASVVVRLFAAKIQNCGREGLHIMTASMQLVHEGCGARHITVDGAVPGHSH